MYYHGTTSALGIGGVLLPPVITGKLCESGRKRNLDRVFFTTDWKSAEIYAAKAVKEFGGDPIILTLQPADDLETIHRLAGTSVYHASTATVLARCKVMQYNKSLRVKKLLTM